MHIVSKHKLGIPQNSRDAFDLLEQNEMLDSELRERLVAMVGFRNIAVHNYQKVQLGIIQSVIEKHLLDFETYVQKVLKLQEK